MFSSLLVPLRICLVLSSKFKTDQAKMTLILWIFLYFAPKYSDRILEQPLISLITRVLFRRIHCHQESAVPLEMEARPPWRGGKAPMERRQGPHGEGASQLYLRTSACPGQLCILKQYHLNCAANQ